MAFTNPLTYATSVSAQTFELLDSTGAVWAYWKTNPPYVNGLRGPTVLSAKNDLSWSAAPTYDSVALSIGDGGGLLASSLTCALRSSGTTDVALVSSDSLGNTTSVSFGGGASLDLSTPTGVTLNARPVLLPVATASATCTANLALTAADVAIPGCSITHTLNANDVVMVTGNYDLSNAGVTSAAWGTLYVNGAVFASSLGPGHTIGAGGRSTVSMTWRYTAATAGSYTFVMRARQTGGTWTAVTPFGAGGCNLSTVVYGTT